MVELGHVLKIRTMIQLLIEVGRRKSFKINIQVRTGFYNYKNKNCVAPNFEIWRHCNCSVIEKCIANSWFGDENRVS